MNSLISKTFAVFLCLVPLTVTIKSAIADNSLAQSSAPISKISTWQKFLVNIVDIIPSIPLEIHYSTAYNFIGRPVDFFDPISHTLSPNVFPTQQQNRLRLKTLMEKQGFTNPPEEWWHYTLKNKPYLDSYFNFPINSIQNYYH